MGQSWEVRGRAPAAINDSLRTDALDVADHLEFEDRRAHRLVMRAGRSAAPRQVERFTARLENSDWSCGEYSDKFHRGASRVDDLVFLQWREQQCRARAKRMRPARPMYGAGAG